MMREEVRRCTNSRQVGKGCERRSVRCNEIKNLSTNYTFVARFITTLTV